MKNVVERTYTEPALGGMPVIRSIAAYCTEQQLFTPPNSLGRNPTTNKHYTVRTG